MSTVILLFVTCNFLSHVTLSSQICDSIIEIVSYHILYLIIIIGDTFDQYPSNFHVCSASTTNYGKYIQVFCRLTSSDLSGYIVIGQYNNLSDSNRVEKLTLASTVDPYSPATLRGIGNGLYFITVFPILRSANAIAGKVIFKSEIRLDSFGVTPTVLTDERGNNTSKYHQLSDYNNWGIVETLFFSHRIC